HRVAAVLATPDRPTDLAVVLLHGFLSNKNSTTNKTLTRAFLEQGLATFQFDFFGQGESEGPFERITVTTALDQAQAAIALVASRGYRRIGLIGFILQTIVGALSHLLPIMLAVKRVKSHKKRGPYLEELTGIVEQWRPLQVGAFNMGTVALLFTAGLVWQYSLRVPAVQTAAWISASLLAVGLLVFGVKVVRLLRCQPPEKAHQDD
ncbi:MAG: hypothetical protein KGL03_13280, partial [Nitrospirota bacterium]|nr:hypothetical protein [Nitrospirota bacterium]